MKLSLFLCLSLAMLSFRARADFVDEDEPPDENWETVFIQSNIAIAEWFDTTAEGLDLFLTGKKFSKKKNDTHAIIENSTYTREGESFVNTTSLSLRLRLPNLEEYWQLKFTSYDEATESRSGQKGYLRTTPREQNYGATVGLFRKWGNVRTSFQPRIELTDPLKVGHSLSFESLGEFKTFQINPKFELFASPTRGVGTYFAMNFHFHITNKVGTTLINNWTYEERAHLFSGVNGVSIGQVLTPRTSLSYGLLYNSNNRDNYHIESYSLSVAFSQLVYKRILDYQLVPHLDFEKAHDFAGIPGIVLNVALNF